MVFPLSSSAVGAEGQQSGGSARATPCAASAPACYRFATTWREQQPRGLLAEWDAAAGRLTVQGAAKVPFFNRRILAAQMELPESSIDMIELDVGGGFGARGEFYPEDFLIPFAARSCAEVEPRICAWS